MVDYERIGQCMIRDGLTGKEFVRTVYRDSEGTFYFDRNGNRHYVECVEVWKVELNDYGIEYDSEKGNYWMNKRVVLFASYEKAKRTFPNVEPVKLRVNKAWLEVRFVNY